MAEPRENLPAPSPQRGPVRHLELAWEISLKGHQVKNRASLRRDGKQLLLPRTWCQEPVVKPGPGHGSWPRFFFFSAHTSFARLLENRVRAEHGSLAWCRPKGGVHSSSPPRRECVDGKGKCLETTASVRAEGQRQGGGSCSGSHE